MSHWLIIMKLRMSLCLSKIKGLAGLNKISGYWVCILIAINKK